MKSDSATVRRLREEITRLEALAYLGCSKAPANIRRVEDWDIDDYNITVAKTNPRRVERRVSVICRKPDVRAFRDQRHVSFQGGLYLPVQIDTDGSGQPTFTITLIGISR